MSKFNELVAHVTNLENSNVSQATLDVNFLYEAISEVAPPVTTKPILDETGKTINVDGGKFSE